MAKVICRLAPFLHLLVLCVCGALYEPFPQGYGMGNLGTIIFDGGPAAHSPLQSAVCLESDTLRFGIAASATTFYDDMDNYGDRHLAAVSGGGWLSTGRLGCKAALSNFDALGVYTEQSGYFSCAVRLLRGIRIGAEITGTRMLVATFRETPRTLAQAGFSLRIPVKAISLIASVDHLTVKPAWAVDDAPPPLRIRCAIHTIEHTYGAQGLRIDIVPQREHPVSLAIGQEFRFSRYFAIHGALANNPLFIGIGIEVQWREAWASAALVNHPVLGWSRGFCAQYSPPHPGNRTATGGR